MSHLIHSIAETELQDAIVACVEHGWMLDPDDQNVEGFLLALELGILTGIRIKDE